VRDVEYIGKVREHSGRFEIRVPFRITDQGFLAGPVTIRVLFSYQTCTDAGICYPPEMVAGTIRFEAVTPNPPREEAIAAHDVAATQPSAVGQVPVEIVEPGETGEGGPEVAIPQLTADDWAEHIPWQEWQPGLPEALSRAGHEVYVDFTADWCLTCQSNKKLVLETDTIRSMMRDLRVIPLKADFTHHNPVMFAEIKRFGRGGVPANVVYAPGKPDITALLPELLTRGTVIRALENPEEYAAAGGEHRNLILVLLGGFLGGLVLNVMPCVLPVISIKILSFVQQAGEDPKRVLRLGLAFCAGIMVWFWIFGALAAYGNVPLQSPQVVIGLGSIMFVFSLSLFGVFEIVLPGAAAGGLDAAARREGYAGAFLKGLLATLLGTACTAPFLGFALGYALTQAWWVGLAIFTAAGVGMSSPYLLLSAKPAWLNYIPKPGPWMVTFKEAMGFVLLATAVWLLWILGRQTEADGVVWTVCFWGFLGLAAWMLGRIKLNWQARSRVTMWAASVAVALFGFYFCYFLMYDWSG
jgi:thiol:disulfide interchange protein